MRQLPVERGFDELMLCHPDRVDNDEPRLVSGVGSDCLEVGGRDGACAAALHLLEVSRRPNIAEEEHALQGLDVRAGGDHVDGHGDAQGGRGAERRELALGSLALHVIFAAKSLPLPKTSRILVTSSSAWASSLQKINVLGTVLRPGKISVNSRSRKVSRRRAPWLRVRRTISSAGKA